MLNTEPQRGRGPSVESVPDLQSKGKDRDSSIKRGDAVKGTVSQSLPCVTSDVIHLEMGDDPSRHVTSFDSLVHNAKY
jgi:hypothetical protein